MRLKKRVSTSGRTTVAALLVCLTLVVSGGLFLSSRAQAQGGTGKTMAATSFGPVGLHNESLDLAAPSNNVLIGLLLPAVQKVRQAAARLHVVTADLEIMLPIEGVQKVRSSAKFSIFTTRAIGAEGWVLHVKNLATGAEITKFTASSDVTVRILPAVQADGSVFEPIASSATLNGFLPAVQADGSVRPAPFRDALPPSIIAILIG